MHFFLLILFLWLLVFIYIKLKRRFFNPFIEASSKRTFLWSQIKKVFLVLISIALFIGGCERWYYFHDEIAYTDKDLLNMSYAEQIDLEVYLMDQEKLINLFEGNPPQRGTQDSLFHRNGFPEPEDPDFYLVIRAKNKGAQTAWGCLGDPVDGLLDVDIPPLPPKMDDFTNIVLWWHFPKENQPVNYLNLKPTWKKLYTEKEGNP